MRGQDRNPGRGRPARASSTTESGRRASSRSASLNADAEVGGVDEPDLPEVIVDPPPEIVVDPPAIVVEPPEADPDPDEVIDPRGDRPGMEESPFEDPEAPLDIRAFSRAREQVHVDSDADDLRLIEIEAKADGHTAEANDKTSPAEKESLFTKVMTGLMGISAVAVIPGTVIAIMSYIEKKANGQPTPTPQPRYEITQWLGLSDQEALKQLGDLVKDDKLDYAKQFLVLNFLARTRAPDEKDKPVWKWPASEKLKVVNALAEKFNDYEMYAFMAAYRYGKRFPPFSVSVEVIRLALTKKYHLA